MRTRQRALAADDTWLYYRVMGIMIGMIGSVTASLFSDRLYSEGIYWLVSIAIATDRVSRQGETAEQSIPAPARAA